MTFSFRSSSTWIVVSLVSLAATDDSLGQDVSSATTNADLYRRAVMGERGDAGRGRRLLDDSARTRCLLCHALGDRGGKLAPDLTGVGGRLDRSGLLQSILEPSATIHPDYRSLVVATKGGRVFQGILRPAGDDAVEVVVSDTETVRIARAEIEEQATSPVSLMPTGLHEKLSPAEMADLLAYLLQLAPTGRGSIREALDPREIPRAMRPVSFQPMNDRTSAFHRPVWFGAIPGQPGITAVVEMQRGRIWRIEGKAGQGNRTPFVDLGPETTPGELTGLSSVAFHPDFAHNHRYFLKMHTARGAGRLAVQILERQATEDGLRDSGVPSKLLLKIPVVTEIHNGGHLAFGPDGFLYVGMGDTGPQGDPQGHGQDLGTLLGKMLRIDIDHADGELPYSIPKDNPFRDRPGARPEVWALGLREPWRFSFDPMTGDLWVGDVGQGQYEEVSILRRGENLGWNVIEGFRPHSGRFASKDAQYAPPVFAYSHRVGPSVTGGFVYRGRKQPALVGKYVFGDYETRRVWALDQSDRQATAIIEIGRSPEKIASFGLDAEGEIYIVGVDNGLLFRIDPSEIDLAAIGSSREVVATSRPEGISWRSTATRPTGPWADPGYDDTSWTIAPGGFGSRGTPGAIVRTPWLTPDLWLRREFILPEIRKDHLRLSVHHDEDAEIYINGILAARLPGFVGDYEEIPIADEALASLHPGRSNILAVHCHQVGGGQYIDVGIVETQGRPEKRGSGD